MCIREADLQKVNHIMDHIKNNSMTTSLGRWVVRKSRSKSDNIYFNCNGHISSRYWFYGWFFWNRWWLNNGSYSFYIFSFAGIEQDFIMHLALGTSFSIIIPTSIISTMTHMKFKAVDFSIVKTFGAFVAIGVVFGTVFAVSLKTSSLVLFFSIMTMLFAFYFLMAKEKLIPYREK